MIQLFITVLIILISFYFQTYLILKNYRKYKTISHMYEKPEFAQRFKMGFVFTGILQISFALSILSLEIQHHFLIPGILFFCIGGLSSIFLGFVHITQHKIIHAMFALSYFINLAIGAFFISLSLAQTKLELGILLFVICAWLLFVLINKKQENGMYAIETTHVILSYAWLIAISLIIIL